MNNAVRNAAGPDAVGGRLDVSGPRLPSGATRAAPRRLSGQVPGGSGATPRRISGALAGEEGIQPDSERFDSWMRMATDNKINVNNTWTLALIDYFRDMRLLRGEDNAINFQKASVTLDGCVKIWTSRVDSVATETGKLLSGLQEEDHGSGAPDEEENSDAPSKKRKSAGSSLVPFSKIAVDKYDLEFGVDPLFKKTSAEFDEGGAAGILMNHLGVDDQMRVVFDTSDAIRHSNQLEDVIPESDRPQLRMSELVPDVDSVLDRLPEMTICPTFDAFQLETSSSTRLLDELARRRSSAHSDANTSIAGNSSLGAWSMNEEDRMDMSQAHELEKYIATEHATQHASQFRSGAGDESVAANDMGYDEIQNSLDNLNNGGDEDFGFEDYAGGDGLEMGEEMGGVQDSMQGRHEMSFVDERSMRPSLDHVFAVLDSQVGGNWAGPSHWRIAKKRPAPGPARSDASVSDGEESEAVTPRDSDIDTAPVPATGNKRARRTQEMIDFYAEPQDISALFDRPQGTDHAQAQRLKEISLPQSKEAGGTLLPMDHHYTSKRLMRLFLKPRARVNLHKTSRSPFQDEVHEAERAVDEPGFVPENDFWQDDDDEDEYAGGLEAPVSDQLYADAETDVRPFTNVLSQTAPARPMGGGIHFEKRAKRVDIRKLKETLWHSVQLALPQTDADTSGIADTSGTAEDTVMPAALEYLQRDFPTDKLHDVSTSFCFISLLHLANEKNLRIVQSGRMGDTYTQHEADIVNHVDALKDLRVSRDYDA